MPHLPSSDETVVPLSRFRAALARPRGAQKLDALLSARDPAAAIAALSVPEIHYLIAEVGLDDCRDLVALATPEQIRGCVDLDVWDRDTPDPDGARPWLEAVISAGYEKLGEVWRELDTELAALLLQSWARVYDRSFEEAPPADTEHPVIETPDSYFYVEVHAEDEEDSKLVHQLVEDLYRADMEAARHTLMSARSEPPAELAEMSYRWRAGRMADLGYVDYYEALEVFRPLATEQVHIGEGTAEPLDPAEEGDEARAPRELPVPLIEVAIGRAFLARALDRVTDAAEAARLEAALILLVNKVLAAGRVHPGDHEALAAGTQHATATLALGLETVAGGDPDRAVDALRTISLTRLHRVGHTVTLQLRRLARALAPRAGAAGTGDAALVGALLGARPWYPTHLDDEPSEAGIRPFESSEDVRRAAEALTRLALRIAVVDALGVDLTAGGRAPESQPGLDDSIRTALVRAIAGGELEPAPLSLAEVRAFRRRAVADGALTDEAREAAAAALSAHLQRSQIAAGRDQAAELLAGWLRDLVDTFAPLPEDEDPDPRYVGGVLLAEGWPEAGGE